MENKDCFKSCENVGSAEIISSDKEDMNVTAEVQEVTKRNKVPADEGIAGTKVTIHVLFIRLGNNGGGCKLKDLCEAAKR